MEETCDLCILGNGFAAVNAFNAAAKHLPEGSSVVVIARDRAWGGNWIDQYDFVRLHQPYQAFTAGERSWSLAVPPEHLASKKEILQHFENIVEACVSEKRLRLVCLFEYEYSGHTVRAGRVEIGAVPLEKGTPALPAVRIIAGKFIKGDGANVVHKAPFAFPAELGIYSLRPADVSTPVWTSKMRYSQDKPIYVIGSGKTGMDVINYLGKHIEGAATRIHCISGRGTWFLVRDEMGGTPIEDPDSDAVDSPEAIARILEPFNGTNGLEVLRQLDSQGLVHSVIPDPGSFFIGICSRAEIAAVRAVLSPVEEKIIKAHLVDIVEAGGELTMLLQAIDGKTRFTRRIERGAFIVNCTDHIAMPRHEPVISGEGLVLSPQWLFGFTGSSAHLATHHFYAGTLERLWRQLPRPNLTVTDKCNSALELLQCVLLSVQIGIDALPQELKEKYAGPPPPPMPQKSAMRFRAMLPRIMRTHASMKTRYTDAVPEAQEPPSILQGNLPSLRSRL